MRLICILIIIFFAIVQHGFGQANDDCSGALAICSGNTVAGSNLSAGVQIGGIEADGDSAGSWGGCFSLQNTVWYSFNTNSIGGAATLSMSNIQDNGNPSTLQVAVYLPTNGCAGTLSSVSCGNLTSSGNLNLVGLQPNKQYLILIDGFGNDTNYTKCTFNIQINGQAVATTVQVNHTNATCGNNNATISVIDVNGGTGSYTYSLNQNGTYQASPNFNNVTPGAYTVYVKDAAGCIYSSNPINVNLIPKISDFTINTTNADCNLNNGSAQIVNITGGNAPYTYTISNQSPNTTGSFSNLNAGNYYLVIRDANGCDTVTTFFIEQNNGIETAIPVSTPSACMGATGTIDIIGVTGSTTPQSYVFAGNTFNTLPITGVPAGNHIVEIIDNNNCKFVVYTAYVQEGSRPGANSSATHENCGRKDGTISIFDIRGGVGPYTFSLNGGPISNDSNFTGLSAGIHQVVIYDSYGCTDTLRPLVPLKTGATTANPIVTGANCNVNNGSVTINGVAGGTSPYQYSIGISGFQSVNSFNGLAPGVYWVIIKDANNCIDTLSRFTIDEIDRITDLQYQISPVICGSSMGTIATGQTLVSGGVAPYTYSLNNAPYISNGVFTALPLGSYTLSVKDVNGCSLSVNVLLTAINQLQCEAGPGSTIIRGATAQLKGQTDALLYSWTPSIGLTADNVLEPNASPKQTTTYTLNGYSTEGCTCEDTVIVEVIPFINPPNAFTPDGDNINDIWVIPYLQFYPDCEVDVYNRWGQKVFHAKGYPPGGEWDGKYNGADVPAATYYYVIKLNSGIKENTEEEEVYKGSVTVVR